MVKESVDEFEKNILLNASHGEYSSQQQLGNKVKHGIRRVVLSFLAFLTVSVVTIVLVSWLVQFSTSTVQIIALNFAAIAVSVAAATKMNNVFESDRSITQDVNDLKNSRYILDRHEICWLQYHIPELDTKRSYSVRDILEILEYIKNKEKV